MQSIAVFLSYIMVTSNLVLAFFGRPENYRVAQKQGYFALRLVGGRCSFRSVDEIGTKFGHKIKWCHL